MKCFFYNWTSLRYWVSPEPPCKISFFTLSLFTKWEEAFMNISKVNTSLMSWLIKSVLNFQIAKNMEVFIWSWDYKSLNNQDRLQNLMRFNLFAYSYAVCIWKRRTIFITFFLIASLLPREEAFCLVPSDFRLSF